MAIWQYGVMAIFRQYGHIAIWPYRFIYGQYGCLSRKQWKCSNLVKTVNWLDFPVKNESKIALMRYFPLYNFQIYFIKLKLMAKLGFLHLRSNFLFLWMFTYMQSSNWSAVNIFKNMCKEQHPTVHTSMCTQPKIQGCSTVLQGWPTIVWKSL